MTIMFHLVNIEMNDEHRDNSNHILAAPIFQNVQTIENEQTVIISTFVCEKSGVIE